MTRHLLAFERLAEKQLGPIWTSDEAALARGGARVHRIEARMPSRTPDDRAGTQVIELLMSILKVVR